MTVAYHERFAAELHDALPEGFAIQADAHLVVAYHGGAGGGMLVNWPPAVADKRAAVRPADVTEWIATAARKARRDMPMLTAEARAAAQTMLDAIDAHKAAA